MLTFTDRQRIDRKAQEIAPGEDSSALVTRLYEAMDGITLKSVVDAEFWRILDDDLPMAIRYILLEKHKKWMSRTIKIVCCELNNKTICLFTRLDDGLVYTDIYIKILQYKEFPCDQFTDSLDVQFIRLVRKVIPQVCTDHIRKGPNRGHKPQFGDVPINVSSLDENIERIEKIDNAVPSTCVEEIILEDTVTRLRETLTVPEAQVLEGLRQGLKLSEIGRQKGIKNVYATHKGLLKKATNFFKDNGIAVPVLS